MGDISARVWENHENSAAKWCITAKIGKEQLFTIFNIGNLENAEKVAESLVRGVDKAYWLGRKDSES